MRRLWTLNEIRKIFRLEPAQNDTFKKMWTLNEIKKIGGLDLEELDTRRRIWTKKELLDLSQLKDPEDPYESYALNIYKKSNLENIFAAAWEDMKEVDGSEIERASTTSTQYGKLQYPNGEDNGVIIPDSVTSIGDRAFRGWESNNQPLVMPNSVTSIGNSAFYNWTSNNQPLVIPEGVTSIGNSAFQNWTSNNQPLVIPEGVTSIGNSAFQNWQSNNHPLVIPNSVTTIIDYAFYNWSNVPYVEMKRVTPPTLGNSNAFSNQNDAPIYVPNVSVDDYKNATNWSALASRIFSINDKP